MKKILIWILMAFLIIPSTIKAKDMKKIEIYQSKKTDNSLEDEYFLTIQGEEVFLYSFNTVVNITSRLKGKINAKGEIEIEGTSEDYEWSKQKIMANNILSFKADKELKDTITFMFNYHHRFWGDKKQEMISLLGVKRQSDEELLKVSKKEMISLLGVKRQYMGKADIFVFQKISN